MSVTRASGGGTERGARLALWLQPGVSAKRLARAEALLGGAAAALEAPREQLVAALGLVGVAAARLATADPLAQAEREEAALAARGGRFLLLGEPDYPRGLLALRDPPVALSIRGPLPGAGLAIVGAREAPAAARRLAATLAASAVSAGRAVISGGAYGIDAAAHQGALEAGGVTAAVLGSGVLVPSPLCNRRLFSAILDGAGGARSGALLSELPVRERASTTTFPRRNRLIAALSEAVVVVHADARSGSLGTASTMGELGRQVLAVPGGGAGTAALLAAGAVPVSSAGELLDALGLPALQPPPAGDLLPRGAATVLASLVDQGSARSVAELSLGSGLATAEVAAAVALLCDRGLVRASSPGRFAVAQRRAP